MHAVVPVSDAPLVKLSQVRREFTGPPRVEALQGVDLEIAAGDFLAVQGPSGSGKSTLLNVLGLLDAPTSGLYELAGQDTSLLSSREVDRLRARTFGFVFQSAHLLRERTIAQNVALGLQIRHDPPEDRERRVRDALDLVGLTPRARALGRDVSGGEMQRAAIARALAVEPQIVLADEPTGALDTANAATVIDILRSINALGITVVVITHDDAVAARARTRLRLVDGRFSEVVETMHANTFKATETGAQG